VAYSARPARRWCKLKDALDSIPAEQSADQESFANRKLIRPTLNRNEHPHNSHGHNHVPPERRDRDRDRSASSPVKKTPPTEQTNAENFYYQKQMQSKTPMVVVLRDGEEVHGYIEWYDKNCIKLNRSGAANLMIYKPAIKYMFKEGENGRK
jgi:host factor-I protein